MGGGELVITDHSENIHLKMSGFKYESIKPLLERQSYITSVTFEDRPTGITHDTRGFRKHWGVGNLIVMQAIELGQQPNFEKWLEADPNPATKGRVICCRSTRYRNYNFPWRKILKRIGDRAMFIGTDEEYNNFQTLNNVHLERLHSGNCLDIANSIAGSDLFIGNQSSPFWVAAGLHHLCIQETNTWTPDSRVPYDGAYYCMDGWIDFDKVGI